jgi:hypothetical protein
MTKLPQPTLSAHIDGAVTNRIRVKPRARGNVRQSGGRVRADPKVFGQPYTTVTISIPLETLDAIDDLAERLRMSRSQLLRDAALGLAERTK